MGAVVEILGAANNAFTVFTDDAGHFTASGLLPGLYSVKVTAPSFLPALRDKLDLDPGATLNINITLSTLLGFMQLGPVRATPDDDDWKWTLRSVANRPILRALDAPTTSEKQQTHDVTGKLAFVAGSANTGYGMGSDMSAVFSVERSLFSDSRVAFSGNVGYGETQPGAVLRMKYSHKLPNGSEPTVALTVTRFAPSTDPNLRNAALQAGALAASDSMALGDAVELKFGSEIETIQFLGHVSAFRPHASADVHLSPNTVLEYAYSSSRPDLRSEKGFDSAPDDLSESNPRVSMLGFAPQVESAHHQEVSLSERIGKTNLQVALFSDHLLNPALTGVGNVTAAGGFLLPDITSGTFTYTGAPLDTGGMRVVLQRKLASDLTATVDYAFGGVLNLAASDVPVQQVQQSLTTAHRHALTTKLSGTMPGTHTRWIASYRWINGSALTPVDMFNSSAGQSDPYLNIFIRQPIPAMGGHIEALIDIRNLLAQGYVPVISQDGQTIYLVDSARSIRGGIAFTF